MVILGCGTCAARRFDGVKECKRTVWLGCMRVGVAGHCVLQVSTSVSAVGAKVWSVAIVTKEARGILYVKYVT